MVVLVVMICRYFGPYVYVMWKSFMKESKSRLKQLKEDVQVSPGRVECRVEYV